MLRVKVLLYILWKRNGCYNYIGIVLKISYVFLLMILIMNFKNVYVYFFGYGYVVYILFMRRYNGN